MNDIVIYHSFRRCFEELFSQLKGLCYLVIVMVGLRLRPRSVKADYLFSYQPPVNVFALLVMLPASYILSPRWFHKVGGFMLNYARSAFSSARRSMFS